MKFSLRYTKKPKLFIFSCLFFAGFFAGSHAHAQDLTPATATKLAELRTQVRTWAPICADGSFTTDIRNCPFGDMLEFAGILCLSGEKDRCDDVKRSQDPVTGRWWRSPGKVGENVAWASFSRDMAQGVFAYLVATEDTDAGEKWMDYIESNNNRLCPVSQEGSDACETRAGFWSQARQVWDYLGLPRRKRMKGFKVLIDKLYSPIEVVFQPHDYPLHLDADSVYTHQKMEESGYRIANTETKKIIAHEISSKEPMNPFFYYLDNGVTEWGAQLILQACPTQLPPNDIIHDWIWQRGFNFREKGSAFRNWDYASGWECIFAVNLLIGPEAEAPDAKPKAIDTEVVAPDLTVGEISAPLSLIDMPAPSLTYSL